MAFSPASWRASASPSRRSAEGTFTFFKGHDVLGLVADLALVEPLAQPVEEGFVGEVLAPQRRVFLAGLGEAGVEVQHSDQARPGSRPVGNGEDRSPVTEQTGEHVVRILPDRLGHDELGVGIDAGEDAHPFLLRSDEAVFFVLLVGMGTNQLVSRVRDAPPQCLFHLVLGGPAVLVGRKSQVAAGDQVNLFLLGFGRLDDCRNLVGGHDRYLLFADDPTKRGRE